MGAEASPSLGALGGEASLSEGGELARSVEGEAMVGAGSLLEFAASCVAGGVRLRAELVSAA
jgi:hypothetical protein